MIADAYYAALKIYYYVLDFAHFAAGCAYDYFAYSYFAGVVVSFADFVQTGTALAVSAGYCKLVVHVGVVGSYVSAAAPAAAAGCLTAAALAGAAGRRAAVAPAVLSGCRAVPDWQVAAPVIYAGYIMADY